MLQKVSAHPEKCPKFAIDERGRLCKVLRDRITGVSRAVLVVPTEYRIPVTQKYHDEGHWGYPEPLPGSPNIFTGVK